MLNYFCIVFSISIAVVFRSFATASSNELQREQSTKVYFKRLVLKVPAPFHVGEIHMNSENKMNPDEYDYVLTKSILMNFDLAENDFNFYNFGYADDNIFKPRIFKTIHMKKNFAKILKKIIIYWIDKEDKTKVYKTLNHVKFRQLINSYDLNTLGTDFLIHLICCYPKIFKNHLHLINDLKSFSFLIPEIAVELFEDRNHLVNPFSYKNLVRTVDLEVLIALLDLWDYELKKEDIEFIFEIWINNPFFIEKIEEDPRSWLLWKKLNLFKPIPIDKLLNCIENGKSIVKFTNLIMALIHHTELIIFESLCRLDYIYADLHKNDGFEFLNFSSDFVSMLNINKCTIWYEKGKDFISQISEQMNIKRLLIDKLVEIKFDDDNFDPVKISLRNNILFLLKIPLFYLNRVAFIQCFDFEIVKKVSGALVLKSSHFCPVVMNWQVGILQFWIVLWSQLKDLGIVITYDVNMAIFFNESANLIELLNDINYNATKNQVKRTYWHIPLAIMVLKETKDIDESDFCIDSLISYMKNQSCEFLPSHFQQIRANLAQESVDKKLRFIEYFNSELEIFKIAPEMLTRAQIRNLLLNQQFCELPLFYYDNFMKLRTLVDFKGFHLLQFFPIGSDYHLEFHEALHTARPEALIEYLTGSNGGLNYPEQFLLSVHPIAWKYLEFVNLVIYNVPFSFFLKHPKLVELLNLYHLVLNIKESLECDETDLQIQKKIIIKWLIHVEWIFNQFHVVKFSNPTQIENIENIYNNFVKPEKGFRAEIVAWLKLKSNTFPSDPDWIFLCKIVETLPLSFVRLSTCYNYYVSSHFFYNSFDLCNIFDQFSKFNCKIFPEISLFDLDQNLHLNLDICKDLIGKYFDPIEKEIWLSRLNISNLISVNQFDLQSEISMDFLNSVFKDSKVPIHETQVTFDILSYLGFGNHLIEGIENEFLEPFKMKII